MEHRNRIIAVVLFAVVAVAAFFVLQKKPKPATPALESKRAAATRIVVSVEPASVATVRDSLSVVALVDAWRDVDLHAETSGIVRKVRVEVGQRLKAGQTLFNVDDEVAASVRRKALVNRELAYRDFERYEQLHKEGAVSASSFEAMRLKFADAEADLVAARRRLEDTAIKAPFAGVVTSKLVEVGDLVQPGTKVANIVDLSKLKIRSSIPEKHVSLVTEGMPVKVTTDVWPGKVFEARVLSVSAKSSRDHTYEVESLMPNPLKTPFRAGMFARTTFVPRQSREALLIPRQALIGSASDAAVFVLHDGKVHLMKLVAGAEYGTRIEVVHGLAPGDKVVVSGQSDLDDGSLVTVTSPEEVR